MQTVKMVAFKFLPRYSMLARYML